MDDLLGRFHQAWVAEEKRTPKIKQKKGQPVTVRSQMTRLMQIRYRNSRQWVKILGLIRDQDEAGRLMGRIERCEEAIADEMATLLKWGASLNKRSGNAVSSSELKCLDRIEHRRDQNNAAWMDAIRAAYMANPRKARAVMLEIAKNDDEIRTLRKEE